MTHPSYLHLSKTKYLNQKFPIDIIKLSHFLITYVEVEK